MDRLKSISKSGWHPDKPSYAGASESRSSSGGVTTRLTQNFKGINQVAGWIGKGNGESGNEGGSANVRPVSALRDPASFGPPPKRVPNTGISNGEHLVGVVNRKDEDERPVPPKPYTMNTTGFNPETLPLPPKRVDTSLGLNNEAGAGGKRPPPIPPRLPPRDESALPTPKQVVDMETGGLNMDTIGRLSKAGINVPGFNSTLTTPPPTKPPPPSTPRPSTGMSYLSNYTSNQATPTEGTTFAEKKAALTTANSFYKNPSSVSFSDASAALKTGRNFQQRHGDQVASGYQKSQELGLDKKIRGYGDLYASRNQANTVVLEKSLQSPPPPASPIENLSPPDLPGRAPSTSAPLGHGRRKPPPPPPPKKKPTLQPTLKKLPPTLSSHHSPSQPPTILHSTRPSPSPSILRNNGLPPQVFPESPPDLDLCLSNSWFSKSPLKLPPSIEGVEEKVYACANSWERFPSGRTKHTLVLAIRWTLNLSTTKIRITWDVSAPSATAVAEQKHFPPPSCRPPRAKEWGGRIVNWTRAKMGQQVGNGECWTLAADCFSSLQAEDGAIGAEKIMTAQGTSFGLCIFSHYPSLQQQSSALSGFTLQPGDILQFRSARWIRRDSNDRVVFDIRAGVAESAAGCKDHTAVIETVEYDPQGVIKLGVLEQNSNGVKSVTSGKYMLNTGEMTEGGVRVFRAVIDSWVEFEANW